MSIILYLYDFLYYFSFGKADDVVRFNWPIQRCYLLITVASTADKVNNTFTIWSQFIITCTANIPPLILVTIGTLEFYALKVLLYVIHLLYIARHLVLYNRTAKLKCLHQPVFLLIYYNIPSNTGYISKLILSYLLTNIITFLLGNNLQTLQYNRTFPWKLHPVSVITGSRFRQKRNIGFSSSPIQRFPAAYSSIHKKYSASERTNRIFSSKYRYEKSLRTNTSIEFFSTCCSGRCDVAHSKRKLQRKQLDWK